MFIKLVLLVAVAASVNGSDLDQDPGAVPSPSRQEVSHSYALCKVTNKDQKKYHAADCFTFDLDAKQMTEYFYKYFLPSIACFICGLCLNSAFHTFVFWRSEINQGRVKCMIKKQQEEQFKQYKRLEYILVLIRNSPFRRPLPPIPQSNPIGNVTSPV